MKAMDITFVPNVSPNHQQIMADQRRDETFVVLIVLTKTVHWPVEPEVGRWKLSPVPSARNNNKVDNNHQLLLAL